MSLTRRFVYAAGVDEPIVSVSAAGARAYHFQDGLGSVVALANASGLVTEKYAYTAYGRTVTLGTPTAAYRYTGRRYDEETGLYFYRARAYSAILGRFLQTDPIGTQDGINLYAYTMNDPVNRVDPTGNASEYSIGGQTYGREYNVGLSQYSYGLATTSPYRITDDHINQSYVLEQAALFVAPGISYYSSLASRSLVTIEDAAYNYGSIRSIAGYDVAGTAGRVGDSYNYNIWGVFATANSQGIRALSSALRSEAYESGASCINICGVGIANQGFMSSSIAARYGYSFEQVNSTTAHFYSRPP